MILDQYTTIASPTEGTFRDRGSKFIGYAFPVTNEKEIKEHLQHLKKIHPSAGHVCYAFRINPMNEYWRANDDGEPSSSAGKPILGQIRSMGLQNVLVAVVRYFGGTLLGVPGLIHAYKQTAIEALQQAVLVEKTVTLEITATVSYDKMGDLMKWVKDAQFDYTIPEMGETFSIDILVPANKVESVRLFLSENQWIADESAAGNEQDDWYQ
jgi:uncharacterized YigZ family protein